MKKILGVIAAAVLSLNIFGMTVAAEEKQEEESTVPEATVCLDTDAALSYVGTFGDLELSGLKFGIDTENAYKNGALEISEAYADIPGDNGGNAGIFFNSSDFGLDTLAGCKVTMKVYAEKCGADELALFTDGDIFMSDTVAMTANPVWTDVELNVDEDINNDRFGVLVSTSSVVNGTVCYIDEICVYNKNGAMVENIGDFQVIDSSGKSGSNVLMIVIFVVLIVAVLLVCAYFIIKFVVLRYR